jgi:hypothetical protein
MPIKTTRIKVRQAGRIRFGEKRTAKSGKEYPVALTHFRITSPHRELLERLAQTYPGELRKWEGAADRGSVGADDAIHAA